MSVPPGRPKELTRPSGAANAVSLGSFHFQLLASMMKQVVEA
jgi:hypothetical protein